MIGRGATGDGVSDDGPENTDLSEKGMKTCWNKKCGF